MEHVGTYDGYAVYRNNSGCLEGHKSVGSVVIDRSGNQMAKDIERIITTATTMEEFTKQVTAKHQKKNQKRYNPYKDKDQQTLPFEEQVLTSKKRKRK